MHDARDTGHTCPDTTAPPSRRRLLTGSAATLLAGAAAIATARATTPEATGDDVELIRLCHAFIAADAAVNAFSGGDIPDELWVNYYGPLERLTVLPARTPEGRRLKAEAAYVAIADVSVDDCWTNGMHREELAALSILRDLTGRAAA
jgi:hypothetical protein